MKAGLGSFTNIGSYEFFPVFENATLGNALHRVKTVLGLKCDFSFEFRVCVRIRLYRFAGGTILINIAHDIEAAIVNAATGRFTRHINGDHCYVVGEITRQCRRADADNIPRLIPGGRKCSTVGCAVSFGTSATNRSSDFL